MNIFKPIRDFVEKLDIQHISEARKAILWPLVDYINSKKQQEQPILLNFICTHNSRRSHLAQVWAQTIAAHFQIPHVTCFSGGTEATAVYPVVMETLGHAGFKILKENDGENPLYRIHFAAEAAPINVYSKKYDDKENPSSNFAAIMTCSQADAGCPLVMGSEKRITITYLDPKNSDGTPQQKEVYAARSKQIATEMKYVFTQINQ